MDMIKEFFKVIIIESFTDGGFIDWVFSILLLMMVVFVPLFFIGFILECL